MTRSGAWYQAHPSAMVTRKRQDDLCPSCAAGACEHREKKCYRVVAPEPRDYVCRCGREEKKP